MDRQVAYACSFDGYLVVVVGGGVSEWEYLVALNPAAYVFQTIESD
jgi:hypothetical protein